MGATLAGLETLRTISVGGRNYNAELLLSGDQIQERVEEMGEDLANHYDTRGEVYVLSILNGALHFSSDLRRAMQRANPNLSITSDQIRVSSYAGMRSSGVIRSQGPIAANIAGKHVLVVDDILDSGLTLDWLTRGFKEQGAASLEVAVALDKNNPERRGKLLGCTALHTGFSIENDYVIGYGLDIEEKYRDLDGVYKISPAAI